MRCEGHTGRCRRGCPNCVEAAHVEDMAYAFLCMATLCSVMAKCNTVGRGHVRLLAKSSKCSLCGLGRQALRRENVYCGALWSVLSSVRLPVAREPAIIILFRDFELDCV